MSDYDLIVVGAGPGGYVAAIRAAQRGMKVAVAEREKLGGTCLNRGCIPTKTLMHTATLMQELQNADRMGVLVEKPAVDFARLYERKDEVVSQLRDGIEGLLKANGVALLAGNATIEEPGRVRVQDRVYAADKILIATGGEPVRLPIPGADLPGVMTSDELLENPGREYKKLAIVGGGVIGLEFATIFGALGSEVVVLEAEERILPGMDREISQNLGMILKKRGVEIHVGAKLAEISKEGGGLACSFDVKESRERFSCDGVLMSVGRRARTEGLFARGFDVSALGLERGAIPVDEKYETAIRGIYAVGDVVRGGIQLAHVASAQGVNAVAAMRGEEPPFDMSAVPACVYTNPEIACVGIGADDAKRRGIAVKTGKFVMSANGKNVIEMADRGFVKVVLDRESDIMLGAQLMCPRATDLIGELATAVAEGTTGARLKRTIRAHPTFGEAVGEAIEDAYGHGIHIMPKKRG